MLRKAAILLLPLTNTLCAQTPAPTAKSDLAPLFAHVWRIDTPTPYPNSGSIYIFLPGGRLHP